jgi:methylenetetrahydrofolate reductase (NADPH)
MDISLEIIPRSPLSLKEDATVCRSCSAISCINIPDLTRFSIRSWEACGILNEGANAGGAGDKSAAFIPHLRARDFSADKPFPLTSYFREQGIAKVLVIAGDPPEDIEKNGGHTAELPLDSSPTIGFIKKLKVEMPELEVYAAFDPYRTNIRYELDYLAAKEQAGTSGFMSQPFFDLRLLEIYAEYLEGKKIFWGIAPVLTKSNRAYWESRNRAIFPRSFKADLFWNVNFARQVLDFCGKNNFNIYLMPMKIDLKTYLSGIFE